MFAHALKQKIKNPRFLGLACLVLAACSGGDSNSTTNPLNTHTEQEVTTGITVIQHNQPDSTFDVERLENFNKSQHEELPQWVSAENLFSGIAYPPAKALFCQQPTNADYLALSQSLGGIKQAIYPSILEDAAKPIIQDYLGPIYSIIATEAGSTSPEITRPDTKYQHGEHAFFLSNIFGLIHLKKGSNSNAITANCGLAIPGHPKNFIGKDDSLLVFTDSKDRSHSAVIAYSITANGLSYRDHAFFEAEQLADSRLFNNTLALMTKSENSHQLHVLNTEALLSLQFTETFENETEIPTNVEEDYVYSYFNEFVSASGNYLSLTQNTILRQFDGYKTVFQRHCIDSTAINYEQETCQTLWEERDNPNYIPPAASGHIDCNGDLASCLDRASISVNPFIRVAVGRECSTQQLTRYECNAYETETYQEPTFSRTHKTELITFSFENDRFIKLNPNAGIYNEENDSIEISSEPNLIEGNIHEHSHIVSVGDYLYLLRTDDGLFLSSFLIKNNALIKVSDLEVSNLSGRYSYEELNLQNSGDYLYLTSSRLAGRIFRIDISSPANPALEPEFFLPTSPIEIVTQSNNLITLGGTGAGLSATSLSISADGALAETNSILLGTDYQAMHTGIGNNDQVLTVDTTNQRLVLPYTVLGPYMAEDQYQVHRLTSIDTANDTVTHEFTTDIPYQIQRSLSYSEDLVLGLNDSFIYAMHQDQNWQANEIYGALIPNSVYPTVNFEANVFVTKNFYGSDYQLELFDNDNLIDSQTIMPDSSICRGLRLYFDTDRVLIEQEKQGLYQNNEECPHYSNIETEFKGLMLTPTGMEPWTNGEEHQALIDLINADYRCLIHDEYREDYQELSELPEGVSSLTCYSYEEYDERQDELSRQ